MAADRAFDRLRGGVVLGELGGWGDGPYCARHGAGAAGVVMGTYIVDPGPDVPYPPGFVFLPGRAYYEKYLEEHIAKARGSGGAVAVSTVAVELEHEIEFLQTAADCGADFVSPCLHSVMEMFTSRGLSSALLGRERWPQLQERMRALTAAVPAPVIAKVMIGHGSDVLEAPSRIVEAGVQCVHANFLVAHSDSGLEAVARVKRDVPFLIAGGNVRTAGEARRVLGAGADAVAIATAAMEAPDLCGAIQAQLQTG